MKNVHFDSPDTPVADHLVVRIVSAPLCFCAIKQPYSLIRVPTGMVYPFSKIS